MNNRVEVAVMAHPQGHVDSVHLACQPTLEAVGWTLVCRTETPHYELWFRCCLGCGVPF